MEIFFSIKLYTHTLRTIKLNKEQFKIQWTQHLSKSSVNIHLIVYLCPATSFRGANFEDIKIKVN